MLFLAGCPGIQGTGSCTAPQAVYALPAPAAACAPQAAAPCAPLAAASPCQAAMAASPCATSQPAFATFQAGSLGVTYGYDAASYVRAGFQVPAGVLACGTQWLADLGLATAKGFVCIGNALTPTPQPSARYVQLVPATAGACAPRQAAAPCSR